MLLTVSAKDLRNAIDLCGRATDNALNPMHQAYKMIRFRVDRLGRLLICATDGVCLAMYSVPFEDSSFPEYHEFCLNYIADKPLLDKLPKSGKVTIKISKRVSPTGVKYDTADFVWGSAGQIIVSIEDVRYPDVMTVVPPEYSAQSKISTTKEEIKGLLVAAEKKRKALGKGGVIMASLLPLIDYSYEVAVNTVFVGSQSVHTHAVGKIAADQVETVDNAPPVCEIGFNAKKLKALILGVPSKSKIALRLYQSTRPFRLDFANGFIVCMPHTIGQPHFSRTHHDQD